MRDYSEYIGKKWVYIENDCIAVVCKILGEMFGINVHNIPLPDESNFDQIKLIFAAEAASDQWNFIDKPKEGCVVLFYDRKNDPIHVGLYVGSGKVIHCPGTPKSPGSTQIDKISDLPQALYSRFECYEYNPN